LSVSVNVDGFTSPSPNSSSTRTMAPSVRNSVGRAVCTHQKYTPGLSSTIPSSSASSLDSPLHKVLDRVSPLPTKDNVALGGVVASVLAIGPKVRGFKHERGRCHFKSYKILTFLGGEVMPSVPCRKSSRLLKVPYDYERDTFQAKFLRNFSKSFSCFATICICW
jgi:hypothetical protein